MKSLRYMLRLSSAFVGRFKGVLVVGVGIGLVVFFALITFLPRIAGKSIEEVGITGRYHTDSLPRTILAQIGDGLTVIDETGEPKPGLADSWKSQDDGKTWVFTLKDNIAWHDGVLLTSNSIVYEFSDVKIERPDDKTIIFKLDDPFSPFPSVVSMPTFRKGLLGTGNWKVEKVTLIGSFVSELILIDANDNQKIYKFYPTESQTKLAFKKGEIDQIVEVFDPMPLDTWETANTKIDENDSRVTTLFFNTQDKLLSDKSVRQALIYAINKRELSGKRAISPISPSSWGYNSQVKKYTYNTERAVELLEDIPDELLADPVKIVSTPILLPVAEKIAQYWTEIGIKSIVQVSSIIPEEFQVYLTIFDLPKDPDQYSVWHSTQEASNISNFKNDRVDKLLEDGRTELEPEARRKIYLDFQRFLVEDSPAAFLYYPQTYTITRK